MPRPMQPDKICHVGGREFQIYREYDDFAEHDILIYPDFEESPQYTAEGRPFTAAVQESCIHGQSLDLSDPNPGDCGGCRFFRREETPLDAIGICMCEKLRQKTAK